VESSCDRVVAGDDGGVGLHSSTGLRWVKGNGVSWLNTGTKLVKGGRGVWWVEWATMRRKQRRG
jgi:hypothetical protein